MANSIYETHIMREELLPFIYHKHTARNFNRNGIGLPNWHENIELLLCVDGEGKVKCDTKFYDFGIGDVVVVNSNTLHTIISETSVTYHCLIIDRSFLEENGIPINSLRFTEHIKDTEVTERFTAAVESLELRNNETGFWLPSYIRSFVLQLMVSLCKKYVAGSANNSDLRTISCERVKKVMLYIHDNLSKQLTLDEIAEHIGISKYHLSREFKDWTGKTIFDSINILKCKEAQEMLLNGARVSETATACGFESLSYFSRTFKKHMGILPSECLKTNKKD